jgi:hypothetical protein
MTRIARTPVRVHSPDGFYRATRGTVCAGMTIEDGKITACAPILRRYRHLHDPIEALRRKGYSIEWTQITKPQTPA